MIEPPVILYFDFLRHQFRMIRQKTQWKTHSLAHK